MFKKLVACAFVFAALSPMALAACAGGGASEAEGADDQDIVAGTPQASFAGSYVDKGQASQDFGALDLKADGSYTARVLTEVVRSPILCNHAPCNASEAGTWSISRSADGIERLRLKPQASPVRIYVVSKPIVMCIVAPCPQIDGIRLERRTSSQVLHREPAAEPANCQSLGGQCMQSGTDAITPARCQDFGVTPLEGKCASINEACCSFTTHEPPHAPKCAVTFCAPERHCVEQADGSVACVK